MKTLREFTPLAIAIAILIITFRSWFGSGILTATDFPYLFPQQLAGLTAPSPWNAVSGNGLGGTTTASLNLDLYVFGGISVLYRIFHTSWPLISRLLFFWPFLLIGVIGSWYLLRPFKSVALRSVGTLIYMANTYVLMIASGGQAGILLAYSVTPFVIGSFIFRSRLLWTISMSALLVFDLRYAYIMAGIQLMYGMLFISPSRWAETVREFLKPIGIVLAVNLYWLIPLVTSPSFAIPEGYGSVGWLDFLSWADFSKTISLLHPNWPENVFGKTYFLRPEYLVIPIMAYAVLLFRKGSGEKRGLPIIYFAILGIIGAFLSKGVKPPLGELFRWMFDNLPLFSGFRDPTKFYVLVALSYAVLIPYTIAGLSAAIKNRGGKERIFELVMIFLAFWLILLIPVWRQAPGTFSRISMPSEYVQFAEAVSSDSRFSRILSVPRRQRFLFGDQSHPIVDAEYLSRTTDTEKLLTGLADPSAERMLLSYAVKYVVVPTDPLGDVFLTDRKYDAALRERYISELGKLPFLTRLPDYGDLAVFVMNRTSGHFYRELENLDFEEQPSRRRGSSDYSISLPSGNRPVRIVFSEAFNPSWKLWDGKKYLQSHKTDRGLNEFTLETFETSEITVLFDRSDDYARSFAVSIIAVALLSMISLPGKWRRKLLILYIMVAAVWVGSKAGSRPHPGLLTDRNVSYSSEWNLSVDPATGAVYRNARFGGSRVTFAVRNADSLFLKAESMNKVEGEQILRIRTGNREYRFASPFTEMGFELPLGQGQQTVVIDLICKSALVPCDVRLTRFNVEGGETAPEAHKDMPVFAVFGDSIATSYGEQNFTYRLADRLGYRLHNASVFGSTLLPASGWDHAGGRVDRDIIRFKPDLVLLFIGTNDLAQLVPAEVFGKAYRELIAAIRTGSPETDIIAAGILPRYDLPVFAVRAYNEEIRAAAAAFELPFIDTTSWLKKSDYSDDVHPSKDAEEKLSDRFYETLRKVYR